MANRLELIGFLGGPWDGEVRRILPMPEIKTKAGGLYQLTYQLGDPHKLQYTWRPDARRIG